MKKWLLIVGLGILALIVAASIFAHLQLSGALSGVAQTVSPGDLMPPFSLQDYDGAPHTLDQYAGKIIVLDFCSHKCPFSRGVDPDTAALARAYADNEQVVVLGLDSHYDTTANEIKAYAEANGLPQPILLDPGNRYADAVGALVTPDFFVIDQQGRLAYRGAFDNRVRPDSAGSRVYVADAVAALLAGEEVSPTQVSSWGCTIKRAP